MIWYVESGSLCGLVAAKSSRQARSIALSELGTLNGVSTVRRATEADIAWVVSMGGTLPVDTEREQEDE